MPVTRLLVANRGEIAVRIIRAAHELGVSTVAVHAADDADSLHVRRADDAVALAASGPSAYLDVDSLLKVAADTGCDAVHPGYGFLSERAAFAGACLAADLTWVGPRPELLDLFGDKAVGRALASRCGVPVLAGTDGAVDLDDALEFLARLGAGGEVMLKAVAGGGGRGMRAARTADELREAWGRCRAEAEAAFGVGELYVERLLPRARHLEVQVVGDGSGDVVHLGERDCSLQRRHQKLVEIAPAPRLSPFVRGRLLAAAVRMAEEVRFDNVGTFEFLVDATAPGDDHAELAFLEANPRLQVEHTVTEEVTGVDLVQAQLLLAGGSRLADLGLTPDTVPEVRGVAVQVRVNLERVQPDGSVKPTSGTLAVFEPPSGPGVRVDTFATAGYRTLASYDPLLAKVIAHAPSSDPSVALRRVVRALRELRVEGVATNAPFLAELVSHPDVAAGLATTTFVDAHAQDLAGAVLRRAPAATSGVRRAGALVDSGDPLAVLEHGKRGREEARPARSVPPPAPDAEAVVAPLQGTVVAVEVADGDEVAAGRTLVVLEAMKMQHEVRAPGAGVVHGLLASVGDTVPEGEPLLWLRRVGAGATSASELDQVDLEHIRPDLAEVIERHAVGLDERRPDAVAKRRATGQRTARENIADLVDPGSFIEYGPLTLAAQRRRRSLQELIEKTPADGLVGGVATVNADLVGADRASCVVATYDYTVLAGTQGGQNHRKKDRLFELAEKHRLPVVMLAEGGGGRPGDTDGLGVAGLDCMAFHLFGRLSGHVPLVGIVSGFCFAGNAALLGSCDVIIATERSYIGMGGPAMIEGGGLGVYRPEEVGPLEDQVPNGVVDIVVPDEAAAVATAKQYLSYVQGRVGSWDCVDQRLLRHLIPENRLRVYDVRPLIDALFDAGSVLELRRAFGVGMVTALARVEGRPVAVVANDPAHLGGAIDAAAAEKAAAFLRRCESYRLPVVFLCDTPGFMVGPEAEREGLVRRAGELFGVAANLSVPYLTVVLRKGYGLGAQAMAGGSFKAPMFTISWPTGEFGGMGLEGAVKLGYRNELAAIDDPDQRRALFEEMVARMYEHGKAVSMASHFEIDGVIDPADTRRWILAALRSAD